MYLLFQWVYVSARNIHSHAHTHTRMHNLLNVALNGWRFTGLLFFSVTFIVWHFFFYYVQKTDVGMAKCVMPCNKQFNQFSKCWFCHEICFFPAFFLRNIMFEIYKSLTLTSAHAHLFMVRNIICCFESHDRSEVGLSNSRCYVNEWISYLSLSLTF